MGKENQEKGEDSSSKKDLETARSERKEAWGAGQGHCAAAAASPPGSTAHLSACLDDPASPDSASSTKQPCQLHPQILISHPTAPPVPSAGTVTTPEFFSCFHVTAPANPGHHPLTPQLPQEPVPSVRFLPPSLLKP